jgi:hypothetical protein
MEGVIFFRVTSATLTEGVANLNATATARRIEQSSSKTLEAHEVKAATEPVTAA